MSDDLEVGDHPSRSAVAPERQLVVELERDDHPDLPRLRVSLAVGAYVLGGISRCEAEGLSGLPAAGLDRLVGPVEAAGGAPSPSEARPLLSVVVPVCNEEECLPLLHERLSAVLDSLGDHEVIFVDDGSTDASVAVIIALRDRDPSVKLIRLSRNFGHQAALSAGIDHACGEAVVLMDADLQDPPELLGQLVARWRQGFHVVYAVRSLRHEGRAKRAAYFVFYRIFRWLSAVEVPLDAGDFCLMDRKVAEALSGLRERHRFLRGLRSWTGYRQVGVPYDRPPRQAGTPAYSFTRLVRLALDGLLSFSSLPLRFASYLGFLTAAGGVVYVLVALFTKVFVGHVPAGWTSIIAIILVLGGAQILLTGVVGEYLARVYDETKDRPLYIIDRSYGITTPTKDHGHLTPPPVR